MKKDMTENRDVVNGNLDYTNGNVYNKIEQHLNIKRICDSRDCSERDSKAGVTTRDAQNQTSDSTYLKMTIKKIIKEKIMEMQSFDTGQLQSKLIRMEEENFNLRNRAIVLEERIKFLEKQCKMKDNLLTTGDSSPSRDEKEDVFEMDESTEDDLIMDFSIQSDKPAEQSSQFMKSTTFTESQTVIPAVTPRVSNVASPGSSTITASSRDSEQQDTKCEVSESNTSHDVKKDPMKDSSLSTSNGSVSPRKGTTLSEPLISPRIEKKITPELANSSAKPKSSTPELSIPTNDLIKPRGKDISPARKDVSTRLKPKEPSLSPHSLKPKEPPIKYSSAPPVEPSKSGGSRPIPSLVPISVYSVKNSEGREPQPRDFPNSKVELYEKQLLGQISPKPFNKDAKRQPVDIRGHANKDYPPRDKDKTLIRTARDLYSVNDSIAKSAYHYSPYKQSSQTPRSNSESSIILNNVPMDDLNIRYGNNINNNMPQLPNPNSFKPKDIIVGDSQRAMREYGHTEIPNERKIEKIINPYMNGYTSVHQSMQGISEQYAYSNPNARYDNPVVHPSQMEIKRYDPNTRTLNNFAVSPNSLSKQQLKRTSPGYPNERSEQFPIEYEPLSKVSPNPPPLISGHNLPPTNRFPVRQMTIQREPMGIPRYPTSPPNYPQSVAKYNISASNFHATSRIPTNYQITNPNYQSSSTNFPSNFDNRLALPQLVAHITSDKSSIIFTWDKVNNASHVFIENVDVYFLFAFHTLDLNQPPPKETSYWKRISIVNPLPLPIACTLTQSFDGQNYFFAVAAVNRAGVVGQLSNPCALKVAL